MYRNRIPRSNVVCTENLTVKYELGTRTWFRGLFTFCFRFPWQYRLNQTKNLQLLLGLCFIIHYGSSSVFVFVFGCPAARVASLGVVVVFLEKPCAIISSDTLSITMSQETSGRAILSSNLTSRPASLLWRFIRFRLLLNFLCLSFSGASTNWRANWTPNLRLSLSRDNI